MTSRGSLWSLWSTDSVLAIGSHGSALSFGSVGSVASIASIGSAASMFSVGSVMSMGSALSCQSRWSLFSFRSFAGLMGLRSAGSLRAAGPPAILAGVAAMAWLGYLRERRNRRPSPRDHEGSEGIEPLGSFMITGMTAAGSSAGVVVSGTGDGS